MLNFYLKLAHYVNKDGKLIGGEKFQRIFATARQDNLASQAILAGTGFEKYGEEVRHGSTKNLYNNEFVALGGGHIDSSADDQ